MAVRNGLVTSAADEQMSAVLYWYENFTSSQRDAFMKDLLCKAVPHKMFAVIDAMNGLTMDNELQSMFQCQMRLFDNWFRQWTVAQRNQFIEQLEQIDAPFVALLNSKIAETSGQL